MNNRKQKLFPSATRSSSLGVLALLLLPFAADPAGAQDFRGGRRGGGFGNVADDDGGGVGGRGAFGGGNWGGGRRGSRRGLAPGATERASFAPLELHGMFGSGENAWVSITDAGTGASKWVRVRDPNPNEKWFVESVNPRNRSAIVRMDGMALKLEMITNTGEPMSIAPQPVSLPVSDAGADATAFDARGVAAEMMASRGNPEQIRAFAERMREMTPEQRLQVAAQFRQMRGGANATGAVPAPVSPPPPDQ